MPATQKSMAYRGQAGKQKHDPFKVPPLPNAKRPSSPIHLPLVGQKKAKPELTASVTTPKAHTIKAKEDPMVHRPTETFKDVAGLDPVLEELFRLLQHAVHPELGEELHLGDLAPRGILLSGPPGSGKTFLAHAIAGQMERTMIKFVASEIVTGISGDSEERLREIFRKAVAYAPAVLFIDEIETITQKKENASKSMEERIVSTLRSCLDDLSSKRMDVIVVATTNSPDDVDPGLRRAGRFEHEIRIGIPNEACRLQILKVLSKDGKVSSLVDWEDIAHRTPGYVGADLKALIAEAAKIAIDRVLDASLTAQESQQPETVSPPITITGTPGAPESGTPTTEAEDETLDLQLVTPMDTREVAPSPPVEDVVVQLTEPVASTRQYAFEKYGKHLVVGNRVPFTSSELAELSVLPEDFEKALKRIQPSAKREGFATIPDVSWDDIGALNDIKEELISDILNPIRYSTAYERLGASKPSGVLLCGPPGCGKTLLAKAVANQAGLNFISVKGPELLNMYVGESERAVRQVFMRARNSSPCVVFFDEIDALVPRRSASGSNATERVVTQMLTELDGLEPRKLVFVIGATNRPDILDPAIMRPGRLDKVSYVDLPDLLSRADILQTITKNGKKPPLATDVNLQEIALATDGYSGADLSALVHEAASLTLRGHIAMLASEKGVSRAHEVDQHLDDLVVKKAAFDNALQKIKPSVSEKDRGKYHPHLHKISKE